MGPQPDSNFDGMKDFSNMLSGAFNGIVSDVTQIATVNFGAVTGGIIGSTICAGFGAVGTAIKGSCGAFGATVGGSLQGQIEKIIGNDDGSTITRSDMNGIPNAQWLGQTAAGDQKWAWQGSTFVFNQNDVDGAKSTLTVNATDTSNAILGSAARDIMYGKAGGDWLKGGGGNDKLYGDGGWDRLAGGDGNDRLEDGAGEDYMHGGQGIDTFVFTADSGVRDVIDDFSINRDKASGFGAVAGFELESATIARQARFWIEEVWDNQGNVIRFEDATHYGNDNPINSLAEVRAEVLDYLT